MAFRLHMQKKKNKPKKTKTKPKQNTIYSSFVSLCWSRYKLSRHLESHLYLSFDFVATYLPISFSIK